MIRHTTPFTLIVCLLATAAFAAPPTATPGDKTQLDMQVKVTAVQGKAEFRATPDKPWQPMKKDQVLALGSQIRTGLRSSITMNVGPNAEVVIKSLTIMMVSDLVADNADTLRTRLGMKYGRMKFDVRHVGFKNDFQVATPTGVMAVKGTGGWVITFDGRPLIAGVDTNGFSSILQQFNNGDTSWLSGADQISGAFIDPVVHRDYMNALAAEAAGQGKSLKEVNLNNRLELTTGITGIVPPPGGGPPDGTNGAGQNGLGSLHGGDSLISTKNTIREDANRFGGGENE